MSSAYPRACMSGASVQFVQGLVLGQAWPWLSAKPPEPTTSSPRGMPQMQARSSQRLTHPATPWTREEPGSHLHTALLSLPLGQERQRACAGMQVHMRMHESSSGAGVPPLAYGAPLTHQRSPFQGTEPAPCMSHDAGAVGKSHDVGGQFRPTNNLCLLWPHTLCLRLPYARCHVHSPAQGTQPTPSGVRREGRERKTTAGSSNCASRKP